MHSLNGHYFDSWTTSHLSHAPNYCWPKDLLPTLRQDIRIISYSYDATIAEFRQAGGGNLLNHAVTFLTHLSDQRKGPEEVRMAVSFQN